MSGPIILNQMLASGGGSFADVDCKWEGPIGQALAVRCGETFFVLLTNNGSAAATGNLSLPLSVSKKYQVCAFDPENNTTKTLVTWSDTTSVSGVIIPPMSELVLIIHPGSVIFIGRLRKKYAIWGIIRKTLLCYGHTTLKHIQPT